MLVIAADDNYAMIDAFRRYRCLHAYYADAAPRRHFSSRYDYFHALMPHFRFAAAAADIAFLR